MKQDIEKIILDGVRAPSGENCQPWKFEVSGSKVSIFNIPEADTSLYNSKQKGSYIAHGALIENMDISAQKHGYATHITLFPKNGDDIHVADIVFTKGEVNAHNPLYETIFSRCTNRKDFSGEKVSIQEKDALTKSVDTYTFNSFSIIDDERNMKTLGVALATNERVLFENKKLHTFFYSHIIWHKKDEEKSGGFYVDTLEFLPHQLKAVKIIKNWPLLKILNFIPGVSKIITKENSDKYTKSGAFGALYMKGTTYEDYVNLGRSVERLWLTATTLDIAMHPCNGTIYLMGNIKDNGTADFSGEHVSMIEESYNEIVRAFNAKDSHIGFIFRIGKAEKPTAVAKRIMPSIKYIV